MTSSQLSLRGTWGTVLLPIGADDQIDFDLLGVELDVLLPVGLAGVYTCGTAGEFHTLQEDEFDALSKLVADKSTAAGVAFQIGASHMSGQVSLSRIARARSLRPAAIQVVLPDWLPLSPIEVRAAVERMVAAADPVPIVLYNPPHAKTVCTPEQMADLANNLPGLVGSKWPAMTIISCGCMRPRRSCRCSLPATSWPMLDIWVRSARTRISPVSTPPEPWPGRARWTATRTEPTLLAGGSSISLANI